MFHPGAAGGGMGSLPSGRSKAHLGFARYEDLAAGERYDVSDRWRNDQEKDPTVRVGVGWSPGVRA
jgi:hypothetical protein